MLKRLFTSESVTEGHPDKICDQISDAVLDAILAEDPTARVACETTVTTGLVHVMGEITTSCYVDIPKIARDVVRDIGYDRAKFGFDCDTCAVITSIDEQSPDIAMGVDKCLEAKEGAQDDGLDNGAGDQGMMFGYACDETKELMPLPISLAQKLAMRLTQVRKQGLADYLRPDGKTQVTVEYDEQDRPLRVDAVVVSTQHSPEVSLEKIRQDMIDLVIRPVIPASLMDNETKIYVNPSWWAVLRATPASPDGRSSWTPTAAPLPTAAAPSPARTPPRWTAPPPTPPAGWPRTWWPPVWPSAARSSWPTPSAWPSPSPCVWTPSAPARSPIRSCPRPSARSLTCVPPLSSGIWTCAVPSIAR